MPDFSFNIRLDPAASPKEVTVHLPDEPMRPVELLPVVWSLTRAVIDAAETQVHQSGQSITCCPGCGACCRQLVPVSEPEARHLAKVVADMPPERRQHVAKRFREAQEKAAPVLERFYAASGQVAVAEIGAAVAPYFALHIDCPFLEDENCTIHPDRPSACREYLVTSPAKYCGTMDSERVSRILLPSPSLALLYFSDGHGTAEPKFTTLLDALDWAEAHKDDFQPLIPSMQLFQDFMRRFLSAARRPSPSASEPNPPTKVPLQFRLMGETVSIEVDQPPERIRLDEVLPVLRVIDDKVIDIAVTKNGQPVSCAKGCSACCRAQPIPVTPPEAYELLRLVEHLPEPRQAEIRSRFADRVARLQTAGLADRYLHRSESMTGEQARAMVTDYFGLGLVCPFLDDDDTCSIYEDRPFACRQYLVTSPKENCADPLGLPVEPVPMLISPASTMLQIGSEVTGNAQYTVPLPLALEYAEAHRKELEQAYPSEDVFHKSIYAVLQER